MNNQGINAEKRYRLHTRAGPGIIKNQPNSFEDTAFNYVNQYGKTMDNWNKSRAVPETNDIDTGVQDFLNSQ